MKQALKTILSLVLLSGLIWVYALISGRPFNIDHYFDRTLIKLVMNEPQLLSSIGIIDNTILTDNNIHVWRYVIISMGW